MLSQVEEPGLPPDLVLLEPTGAGLGAATGGAQASAGGPEAAVADRPVSLQTTVTTPSISDARRSATGI